MEGEEAGEASGRASGTDREVGRGCVAWPPAVGCVVVRGLGTGDVGDGGD